MFLYFLMGYRSICVHSLTHLYADLIHKMSIFSNNIYLPSNFMYLRDMFPELISIAADDITD